MPNSEIPVQEPKIYDVVIVGGGIAGLYCCHELIKERSNASLNIQNILLLEASDRFGGRIETWSLKRSEERSGKAIGFEDTWDPCTWDFAKAERDPLAPEGRKQSPYRGPIERQSSTLNGRPVEREIEYLRAEFGPMRIEPRDQPLLQALLNELGIREQEPGAEESLDDLVPFASYASEDPMEPRFTLRGEETEQETPLDLMILALRRIFELVEFDEAAMPWKTAEANERWKNLHEGTFFYRHYWKGELLEWIHNLAEVDLIKIREHAHFRGQPLWNLGFWNVLSDVLSHFAVVKIRDWGSYYHFVHENLNAAEWIIFWLRAIRSTGSLRGIRGGMSRIIWKLLEKLYAKRKNGPSVSIQKGRRVLGLESNDGMVSVTVENPGETIKARRVILALPKRPLEEMSWNGGPPKEKLKNAINAVVGLPLLKCFFIIERPWWEDNRPLNRNAADLPTRELLYMKSNDGTKGLIMVYTDRPAITFWSDYLRMEPEKDAAGQELDGPQLEQQEVAKTWFLAKNNLSEAATQTGTTGDPVLVKEPGSSRLWQRFVQFARDYGHHDFTQDRLLACGIRDWSKKPFGAAAHGWLPGVMSRKHIEFLEAFSLDQGPARPGNIHVCGEAFSDYQGFIEGSLRSAKRVIDKIESG